MRSVTVLAPAKLNLTLDITGIAPNGYHEMDMLMQAVNLYENVTVRKSSDLTVRLPGSKVPANKYNTAIKAA
ncbi:MAG: 4-(cytidine 5'-diphospho)-2-C-methyl-D-erythritol kinase, partial [Oscillospiraceae bacterium]